MKDTRKLEKEIEGAIETTTLNAFAPLSLTRGELERMGSGEGDNVYEALFSGMGDCDPGYYTREAAKESLSMLTMGQGLSDWRASMAECCRKLGMGEAGYHAMERVLRSAAIDLERCWGAYGRVVARCAPALAVVTEFGPMAIIDGDGITVPVDSVANPCVERTRQSSSDSSKRERVTAVKYTGTSLSCAAGGYEKSVLLRLEPHSACGGVDALEGSAHVSEAVRLEESGIRAAQTLFEEEVIGEGPRVGAPDGSPERERRHRGPEGRTCMAINVFDGGSYSQGPFRARDEALRRGEVAPFTLTKADRSGVAWLIPGEWGGGRGRPSLMGPKVKLRDAFDGARWISEFRRVDIVKPSGEVGHYEVATKDLVWGKGYNRVLRFCFSRDLDTGATAVFVTDCMFLTGAQIVHIYLRRFSEEHSFKDVRDTLRALENIPWSKRAPRLEPGDSNEVRKGKLSALEGADRERALLAVEATRRMAFAAAAGQGILALASLGTCGALGPRDAGYYRPAAAEGPVRLTPRQVQRVMSDGAAEYLERTSGGALSSKIKSLGDPSLGGGDQALFGVMDSLAAAFRAAGAGAKGGSNNKAI